METKQSQIKINLSEYLKDKVKKRAGKYGLTLAGFAKYLMVRDLEDSNELDFSEETWKNIEDAKSGKVKFIKVTDTKKFFDEIRGKIEK
jgi:hypothetical protein